MGWEDLRDHSEGPGLGTVSPITENQTGVPKPPEPHRSQVMKPHGESKG